MYQVTHKNIDGSLLHLFTVAPVSATRGHNLNFLSTVVLFATELIHFPLDLSIKEQFTCQYRNQKPLLFH